MKTSAVAFSLSTITAIGLTPLVRSAAHRFGVLDHALSSRKVHGKPIPRLGGIAIVAAFYVPLLALLAVNSSVGQRFWGDRGHALGLIGGGLLIAALGVYDDLRGAGARLKFTVQFAAAALMYAVGFRIDVMAIPFGPVVHLGPFGPLLTLFWIVGVINALNLIDGLDGLAGGVAFVAAVVTWMQAVLHGDPLMGLFMGALAGAVLGFLVYNFNPASIFMGDTGSMFLGFVLATSAVQTSQKSSACVALAVPIVLLGVPICDTLLAIGRRAARGTPLFSADRDHIHHRLLDLGLSQREAVLALYGAAALLGVAALELGRVSGVAALCFLAGILSTVIVVLRRLGYLRLHKLARTLVHRRRNLAMRRAVRRAAEGLRSADDPSAVFGCLVEPSRALGARGLALELDGLAEPNRWSTGLAGCALRARFPVYGERGAGGTLELGWERGRRSVDRDTEIAVEQLCEHVRTALERLERSSPAKIAFQQRARNQRVVAERAAGSSR
ncbi:MAG TPA: MraY family glycosyltransferase [Anaeromyxobacteraceae bacterium]|jgi:UDP-GlcNAc:undecaprenyl-phosphate GlcNAc-1-phosphate transferase|nr:MraY family glycosyltransferase [Anaeromyxobacteraceae bacterium]